MNGAESLVRTLIGGGIDTCFANPGTSEMHFVAALDRVPGMRCVLGLFEGVVTGAADGYYRIADRPASTLLHLGPGLANGLANLHNARKARSGIVNVVGEHATYHRAVDAPLSADVEGIARPMSDWVLTSASPSTIGDDAAVAISIASSTPGRIASLILPADVSWGECNAVGSVVAPAAPRSVAVSAVQDAARLLRQPGPVVLLLGGRALRGRALDLAARIAARTGCRLLSEANNACMDRGAGRPEAARFSPGVDAALASFKDVRGIVLVGAKSPAAFFAYPGRPSMLAPEGCAIVPMADAKTDLEGALDALASELDAHGAAPDLGAGSAGSSGHGLPTGRITPEGIDAVVAALLPEGAIVVDESISTGRTLFPRMRKARPHSMMNSMGASLGYAMPVAIGAAMAGRGRKTLVLSGDGSAMYTLQALWTMAREGLDVTVVIFANRTYEILRGELTRVGASAPGQKATDMLRIDGPALDWVALARGHGVPAGRATDLGELHSELKRGLDAEGPYLVEAVL